MLYRVKWISSEEWITKELDTGSHGLVEAAARNIPGRGEENPQ